MSGALVERTIKSGYQMGWFRLDFSYEIEANIDTKGVVLPSFANLGMCGAYLRYFLPRYFGTGFPLSHLRSRYVADRNALPIALSISLAYDKAMKRLEGRVRWQY